MKELPLNQIIHADCLEFMKTLPDKCIDLVLTDPPYNVGKQFAENNEGKVFDTEFHKKWIKEVLRVLKPSGGGLYMFFSTNQPHFSKMIEAFGEFRQMMFWTKPFAMMVKNRKGYHHFTEVIFWKVLSEDFYFNSEENNKDYFTYTSSIHRADEHDHPTQKPMEFFAQFIKASSKENDIILDPFAGSCTTAVACKQLNRNYICIEKEEQYVKIGRERLDKLTGNLFN